jgi:hypothetical protein
VALCLVAALYAASYGCTPCRLALWLSFGPLGCHLVAGLSFGPHLAVLVVALSCGHSHCCLGHCCRRRVERWSVGLRNEGKKNALLGPPISWVPLSGSSFPSIDGPTSLARGEGHLMCLSSVTASSGDGDDGGGMRKEGNQDQPLILVSNSAPMLNNCARY